MITSHELKVATSLPSISKPTDFNVWEKRYIALVRKNRQALIPSYLVIFNIHAVLNSSKIPLTRLTKNYLQRVLLPVTTALYKNLDSYRGDDKSAASVKKKIRNARVHFNTALEYFDDKKHKKKQTPFRSRSGVRGSA